MAEHVAPWTPQLVAQDFRALARTVYYQLDQLDSALQGLSRRNDSEYVAMHARLDALAGDNQ